MSDNKLISVFLHEGRHYTKDGLIELLEADEEKGVRILKRLKEYGILKTVKKEAADIDLTELTEADYELSDVEDGNIKNLYVSFFVGVIMVEGKVLKCYPKYLPEYQKEEQGPVKEMKQVLEVLKHFNRREQIIHMQNQSESESSFNLLATMLYLLQEFLEYGLYTNTRDVIEINGSGEILWDKTINETFTLISNNRPYYPEVLTKKRVNNDADFIRRLHACVLTECSRLLKEAQLTELFQLNSVELSDELRADFGDDDYILHRIMMELNVQYNTRKQLLLKTLYSYIANGGVQSHTEGFSMFGTNSFHVVWEKVCAEIFDNQLDISLDRIPFSVPVKYNKGETLKQLIEKPEWHENIEKISHKAKDTLIPDIISIPEYKGGRYFVIFDAKYYNMILDKKMLKNQPGIESITKQYLYQLAYREFLKDCKFDIENIRNCFLLPTAGETVINKGYVVLGMMHFFGLKQIEVRLLPAEEVFSCYLENKKYDICALDLYECPNIINNSQQKELKCTNCSMPYDYEQVAESMRDYNVKKI